MGVLDFISKPKNMEALLKSAMSRQRLKFKPDKAVSEKISLAQDALGNLKNKLNNLPK